MNPYAPPVTTALRPVARFRRSLYAGLALVMAATIGFHALTIFLEGPYHTWENRETSVSAVRAVRHVVDCLP